MSTLDGADLKKFEAVPEVSSSYLGAVSGPGSRDGFQGLDLTEPSWGVKMRAGEVYSKGQLSAIKNEPGKQLLGMAFQRNSVMSNI